MLVALVLRLHGLGDKPFWLDELATLHRATTTIPDLLVDSLRSKHYPSYFLLLWAVAKLGTSQWLLRFPSALFGALNAGLVYRIGYEADNRRTGFAAGLIMALSPFDVQYGQEARSYTLVASLILLALWGLVRLARDDSAASWQWSFRRQPFLPWLSLPWPPLPWLAYFGGTAAALNVLNVAVPWLIAANLGAIAIAARLRSGRAAFRRNWGVTQGLVLLAWLPSLLAVLIASHGRVLHGPGWAPPETAKTIWSIIAPVYLYRISNFITFGLLPAAVPGLSLVIAGLAIYGAWRLRHNPVALTIIATAAFLVPVLLLLVSFVTPVLVPRYFAWSAAPFFLLVGAALSRLSTWRFVGGLAALGGIGLVNLLPYYSAETKPRWDLAAATLAAEAQPGDVVLLDSWSADYVMKAFAAKNGLDQRGITLTWKPNEALEEAHGHTIWVAYGRTGQGKMQPAAVYLQSLSPLGSPATEDHFGRYVVVWRFNAPGVNANGGESARSSG